MFVRHFLSSIVIILIYVDDILVTGNDGEFIKSLIHELNNHFAMRLLGPLKQFLGIDVTYTSFGITLSQQGWLYSQAFEKGWHVFSKV